MVMLLQSLVPDLGMKLAPYLDTLRDGPSVVIQRNKLTTRTVNLW